MKMFVCVYKTTYGSNIISSSETKEECEYYENEGYVRITDWVEVDFPERSEGEIISSQVNAIDTLIEKTKEEFSQKIGKLNQKKQELLALTHEVESE
ncbi:MAG: hypothetical protein WC901_00935 [Candidatus Margulisiibacteriota bacterium]